MFYDNYGNILQKNGIQYVYDEVWEDKLIFYNGQPIVYDAQGNPTEYLGHNLTWEKGRQLKSFDNIQYTYNANGIRTSKTIAGNKHTYILDGAKILKEVWDNGDEILQMLYDNEDNICGITYNETPYFFQKNQQGDIIAITDNTGKEVARYSYDAWGVCTVVNDTTASGIATINPFRYRGYYFDREIGMYYLQSRYYDPTVGRFVNGDTPEIIGLSLLSNNSPDTNLFAYCSNSPTNDKDITGYISAKSISNKFSVIAIFSSFMAILYASTSKGLVAVGAYASKVVTPIAIKAFWWKPWLAAALIVAAVAIIVAAVAVYFSKQAKKTAKARAKDAPSWLAGAMGAMPPHHNEKAKDYAKRLLNNKYGNGNWNTGAGSEYSKIVKYLTRHLGMQ